MKTKNRTFEILLKKFPASEYVLMAEVSDEAGFNRSRSADFMVMNLWRSRGLNLIGFERKTHRGDWLKELKSPAKAENIFQYCDQWYLLTDSENVAKIEEIPETWGWMHIKPDGRIVIFKDAPKLNPIAISRSFLSCMLRRANAKDGYTLTSTIQDKIDEARQSGMNQRDHGNQRKIEYHDELLKNIHDFKDETGIDLGARGWSSISGKKAGEFVKFMNNGGVDKLKKDLEKLQNISTALHMDITNAIETLNNQ